MDLSKTFQRCDLRKALAKAARLGDTFHAGRAVGGRVEFRILEPLEVLVGGAAVRVGGPKQRALLALLLCHANAWYPGTS